MDQLLTQRFLPTIDSLASRARNSELARPRQVTKMHDPAWRKARVPPWRGRNRDKSERHLSKGSSAFLGPGTGIPAPS